jgi:hypothetical protein
MLTLTWNMTRPKEYMSFCVVGLISGLISEDGSCGLSNSGAVHLLAPGRTVDPSIRQSSKCPQRTFDKPKSVMQALYSPSLRSTKTLDWTVK